MPNDAEIVRRALAGERRWLSRAITRIESRGGEISAALASAPVRRKKAPGSPHVIGLTGPPGAGKSTFADRLIQEGRQRGLRVAVVAVDPSSPFSGGAILGDRVRMERHTGDDAVYIRSLSSRGHLGGLSTSTADVVDLFDAVGFDRIIVETVGVGQSELGVLEVCDTAIVVLTPESGDTVQTMKAGLLEIADVFVVNKCDRPGADRLVRDLDMMVALDERSAWRVPVLQASALDGRGIDRVVELAEEHRRFLTGEGRPSWERRRGDARVRSYLDRVADLWRARARSEYLPEIEAELRAGRLDPSTAADAVR